MDDHQWTAETLSRLSEILKIIADGNSKNGYDTPVFWEKTGTAPINDVINAIDQSLQNNDETQEKPGLDNSH